MGFVPGRFFDVIPSMRRRRLQDLEDIRTGSVVLVGLPVIGLPETPAPGLLVLTPQQQVKRAGGAFIVASVLWLLNSSISQRYVNLVPAVLLAVVLVSVVHESIWRASRR
jgi:membrane protease YdiL (CAAX protease family)